MCRADRWRRGGWSRCSERLPTSAPPTKLGPLRSVQRIGTEKHLLVGARSGIIDARGETYTDQSVVSQLGFNQAVIWNNEIWASHSEAGIVAWKIGQGERPLLAM